MRVIGLTKAGIGLLVLSQLGHLISIDFMEFVSPLSIASLIIALIGVFLLAPNLPEILAVAEEALKSQEEDSELDLS